MTKGAELGLASASTHTEVHRRTAEDIAMQTPADSTSNPLALCLGLLLILSGCSDPAAPESGSVAPASATGSEVAADAPAPLRLYVFDCGAIRLPTVTDFGLTDEQTEVRTLYSPCYLVEHEAGRLLWDAGLPPVFAEADGWVLDSSGAQHRLDAPMSAQLGVLGLTPGDIDKIAFSHFHYDHVGDANAFLGAELLVSEREHRMAFSDNPGAAFFDPTFYDALRDTPTTFIGPDHDVFGDGRVRIVSAPGHTPGHQVLLLDLQETGPVLLSGDLYHFAASRTLQTVPNFNTDPLASRSSMTRVEQLLEETGATLWIQHDQAFHEGLAHAPGFHD